METNQWGERRTRKKIKDDVTTVANATVAEWLRRLTRNQIPFGSAGSNPAGCVAF